MMKSNNATMEKNTQHSTFNIQQTINNKQINKSPNNRIIK